MPFRENLFVANLGNWKGVGALRMYKAAMVLGFKRL